MSSLPLDADEKVDMLVHLSSSMGVSLDKLLALYVVVEDDIFFMLDLFQGETVKFPSVRVQRTALGRIGRCKVYRLSNETYCVNGAFIAPSGIKKGDLVDIPEHDEEVSGVVVRVPDLEVRAFSKPVTIKGILFLACQILSDGSEEKESRND